MATLRAVTVQEQNANQFNGVQVDTALIGSAGLVIRSGREAPVYVVAGTQTSSLSLVILDLANARAGDRMTIKKYTTAVIGTGVSQVQLVSGSSAGAVIGAFQIGTATPNEASGYFDGVAWR